MPTQEYKPMLSNNVTDYISHFTPNKERQLILFEENIKGSLYHRPIASNGANYLVDISASYLTPDPANAKRFTLEADSIVNIVVPKDDPVQNLEAKYRELMYNFYRSGYTDFQSYSTAQSLKTFALTQGYSFQQIQAWDIGAYPSVAK